MSRHDDRREFINDVSYEAWRAGYNSDAAAHRAETGDHFERGMSVGQSVRSYIDAVEERRAQERAAEEEAAYDQYCREQEDMAAEQAEAERYEQEQQPEEPGPEQAS